MKAASVFGFILFALTAEAICQEAAHTGDPFDTFMSMAAQEAVGEFRARDQFLTRRVEEEREKEMARLADALKSAVKVSAEQGDFEEVTRLSNFLRSQAVMEAETSPQQKGVPGSEDANKSLKSEVVALKREIAKRDAATSKGRIQGKWMRSDGTAFEFKPDGTFVATAEKPGVVVKSIHRTGYAMQCPGYLFIFYPAPAGIQVHRFMNENLTIRTDKEFTLTYVGE